jgi:hypothetical protein
MNKQLSEDPLAINERRIVMVFICSSGLWGIFNVNRQTSVVWRESLRSDG